MTVIYIEDRMTKDPQPPVTSVRLPAELRKELRVRAAENDRTLTSEIVRRLEESVGKSAAGGDRA
ncbi:Arc family DNA-binding protein [Brevundimonas nasdae]|uniref:Arc family DNA-binding protein n=2 Tax=Brevundimonas nasdae TaxID=172043 RepID=UPI0019120E9C|nr:Arc family DNA-binding protein [Brevundimonas nasdae]